MSVGVELSDEDLEAAVGNLTRQALSENQQQFLELAKNEFEKLQSGSDTQLDQKKELIDASLKNIERSLRDLGDCNTTVGKLMCAHCVLR